MPDSELPPSWQANLLRNASRYMWSRAKADPATLSATWLTWTVASGVAAVASLTIIAGILRSTKARGNVFNLLIVFLCVPDFVFSLLCGVTCALSYMADEYYAGSLGCKWQAFYVIFGFTGSMWMQVVIAAELRHALRCSRGEQRAYVHPTLRQVLGRAGAVYALSLFFASWIFLDAIPVRAAATSGMACVPLAHDPGSEVFLWVVYLGVVAFLPLGGILYMAWDIFRRGFHRGVDGATRELLAFFVLVLCVYLIMWLPSVASIWIFDARIPGGNTFNVFGGLWSHLQGLVSAFVFLRKRDVLDAVRRLPLVGYAVGVLADRLPGFRPRIADTRPSASSTNVNVYAGNDPRADSDGARWIMGMDPPEALEPSEEGSKRGAAASPPDRAQRDAPGAEDLACFPPQFPLRSGGGLVGKLCSLFAPRFADRHFEQRYRQHRGHGLDSVQFWFACAMVFCVVSLWVYYLADDDSFDRNANMTLGSRQLQVELVLPHAALPVAWVTWALLRALPCARARGSELLAVQVSVLVALFCWGLPATAKGTCSDSYNTFDGNLQQTLFLLLCYAAVFCRISTGGFVVLCFFTATNFIAARSAWKHLDAQPFALSWEAPKLIATLVMVGAAVRSTDLRLRREFAARELMLMVIEAQRREMEAALNVAAALGREMEAAAKDRDPS